MFQVHVLHRRPAQGVLETGMQFGLALWQRWIRHRKVRQTHAILSQMDDHQLADIGLNRTMIMNVEELLEQGRR